MKPVDDETRYGEILTYIEHALQDAITILQSNEMVIQNIDGETKEIELESREIKGENGVIMFAEDEYDKAMDILEELHSRFVTTQVH